MPRLMDRRNEKEGLFIPDNVTFEQSHKERGYCSIQSLDNRAIDGEASTAERRCSRSSGD